MKLCGLFFPGSDGPGPGQYDPFKDPGIRAPIDLVNEHKPLQSTVLMVSFLDFIHAGVSGASTF